MLLTKLDTSLGFHQFSPNVLFLFQNSILDITVSHHVSLASPGLWEFLSFSWSLINLIVLRRTSQVFWWLSHSLDLPDVFLMVRLDLWVLGRMTTEVKCLSPHVMPWKNAINMTYHWWYWPWFPGQDLFPSFLHCKLIHLPVPFHIILSVSNLLSASHILVGKRRVST